MATTHSTPTTTARHRGTGDGARAMRIPRQAAHALRSAPLFDELAREWAARGATVPGEPDPAWQRMVSWEHFQREIASVVRDLHLRGPEPLPEPAAPISPPRWRRV
ncbi:hypothetical protein [Streptomyces sp. NBC_01565]|uniref:hypothetical protein n=1 Tax=unclassified Streptomyces TaxID=2593676 RepID=UPI002256FEAA|nr:hypothetical protein [Streptomyces sp. NBC_01565]MCX4545680.1 hypothetical protein [Streptomyces sp. NBC_01565]